ncbi:hypothetical protein Nepgr_017648 [Nepenthes gracilis]|uniref:Uncharacterized protein n=1 Tax=Nepenthes gracilis TaxID=150966 RepID=A0AAD3XSC4_NEPGR|nr:hypothetical protein Nepgr_017648 [Nepenthes gracilis]
MEDSRLGDGVLINAGQASFLNSFTRSGKSPSRRWTNAWEPKTAAFRDENELLKEQVMRLTQESEQLKEQNKPLAEEGKQLRAQSRRLAEEGE